jgi:hypothetical protein
MPKNLYFISKRQFNKDDSNEREEINNLISHKVQDKKPCLNLKKE